jgi:phage shock protein C
MEKLFRSKSDSKIAGICGGLGEMFNVDPTIVRLAVVFGALLTAIAPFVIVYIVGWIIIPEGFRKNDHVKDSVSPE